LDRNVAAYLAHDWKIEKFADQEALVVTKIGYDDLKEVIGLAGDEMAGNNLRHRNHGLLELQRTFIVCPSILTPKKTVKPSPIWSRRRTAR